MRKGNWFWMPVIILVFGMLVVGCGSTGSASVASGTVGAEDAVIDIQLNGLWRISNGQLMLFWEKAFLLMNDEGMFIQDGILTHTNTQFVLNFDADSYASFDYSVVSGNIRVISDNNTWADGVWQRISSEQETSDNPLVGYWENTIEERISIMHILPYGWGTMFNCDLEYTLENKGDIGYDDNDRSQFQYSISGDGYTISMSYKYVFDGEDILIGVGDDVSTYRRFIRK